MRGGWRWRTDWGHEGLHRDVRRIQIPRHSYLKKEVLLVQVQTYRMVWINFVWGPYLKSCRPIFPILPRSGPLVDRVGIRLDRPFESTVHDVTSSIVTLRLNLCLTLYSTGDPLGGGGSDLGETTRVDLLICSQSTTRTVIVKFD